MKKILALALVLVGCSSQPPSSSLSKNDPQWQQHLAKISKEEPYQAEGQIGVITKDQRFSSSFHWDYQHPQSFYLHLSAFLNVASMDLQMTPQGLRLTDDKGQNHYGEEAEFLLHQVIGDKLSLTDLAQWLKGVPPQGDYVVGANHLLQSFRYQGWFVEYLTYHQDSLPMPKDIRLTKGNTQLKLRIRGWQW